MARPDNEDRPAPGSVPGGPAGPLAPVDHLVFAVPDLEAGARLIEERLGVETSPGGRHDGLGTRNRLVGLGADTYLEVVSIDPGQPTPDRARWFGLDELTEARLVTWCARSPDLRALVERGREAGIDLGEAVEGSRQRPDGSRLEWTFSDPWADRAGGVVPFFIDWGDTRHPAADLPRACTLPGLRVEHPDPSRVGRWMRALGLETPVTHGEAPRVVATLGTPNGVVELT